MISMYAIKKSEWICLRTDILTLVCLYLAITVYLMPGPCSGKNLILILATDYIQKRRGDIWYQILTTTRIGHKCILILNTVQYERPHSLKWALWENWVDFRPVVIWKVVYTI